MSWIGKPFEDPSGLVLGHVTRVEPDGTGGQFLIVHGDWGALDWLHALGAAHSETGLFRFHSTEVEEVGSALRLRADAVEDPGDERDAA